MPPAPELNAAPRVNLTHPSALARLERRVAEEALQCWLLVGMAAVGGGMLSISLTFLLPSLPAWTPFVWSMELPAWLPAALQAVDVLVTAVVGALVTVLLALHSYRQRYRAVSADLVWGQLALTLVEPSYGELIESLRREHYRPTVAQIHVGSGLQERLTHLAQFYPQYYQLSRSPREPAIPAPLPSNCWLDGAALVMCSGCPLTLPLLIGRILMVYPRLLATKRAALDYFSGKWDAALEQQYISRN